jgi:hypothetical protein
MSRDGLNLYFVVRDRTKTEKRFTYTQLRFQDITAANMKIIKMNDFWDVAPYNLEEVYRRSKVLAVPIIRIITLIIVSKHL